MSSVRTTGFQPIHPRKLYVKLLACASGDERAKVTLDFLCGCTGAASGHLFLLCGRGLREAASSEQGETSPDLLLEAERALNRELDSEQEANRTRTMDTPAPGRLEPPKDQLWTSTQGAPFMRHVLGTYHDSTWTLVGIAMLESGAKKVAPLRNAYVEVICNAFIAAGEVPSLSSDATLQT